MGRRKGEPRNKICRTDIDWKSIEAEYRLGATSVEELAAQHGIPVEMIRERAKDAKWLKDRSRQLHAKTQEILLDAEGEVSDGDAPDAEERRIAGGAQTQAKVIRQHRGEIARTRNLCIKMLVELETITDLVETFEKLGDFVVTADNAEDAKRSEVFRKTIGLTGRISNLAKLTETLQRLITVERQAYSITDNFDPDPAADKTTARETMRTLNGAYQTFDAKVAEGRKSLNASGS